MPQSGDYVMSVRFLMCQSLEEIVFRPVLYDSRFDTCNPKFLTAM